MPQQPLGNKVHQDNVVREQMKLLKKEKNIGTFKCSISDSRSRGNQPDKRTSWRSSVLTLSLQEHKV